MDRIVEIRKRPARLVTLDRLNRSFSLLGVLRQSLGCVFQQGIESALQRNLHMLILEVCTVV